MSAPVEPDDRLTLEQQVCFSLTVASREVISLYRPLLEPLGLTHPQYLVMITLWQNLGPVTVKDLSARLMLDPPTLSPLLKRLESAGLVQRRRDPANERALQITLTEQGQRLRERAAAIPATLIERLGMTQLELDVLHDVLARVIEQANPTAEPATR